MRILMAGFCVGCGECSPISILIRVQDTELFRQDDRQILEWAAQRCRLLLTDDAETMIAYAHDRLANGLPMPGLIVVRDALPINGVIQDILLIDGASDPSEWENVIRFLPL
jgi:hypothetical protein